MYLEPYCVLIWNTFSQVLLRYFADWRLDEISSGPWLIKTSVWTLSRPIYSAALTTKPTCIQPGSSCRERSSRGHWHIMSNPCKSLRFCNTLSRRLAISCSKGSNSNPWRWACCGWNRQVVITIAQKRTGLSLCNVVKEVNGSRIGKWT